MRIMSKVTPLIIPSQKLRRSCRRAISDDISRYAEGELDTKCGLRKKFKIEPRREERKLSLEELDKPTQIKEEKICPVPDGFLYVDANQLDLERTLMGGQSFRWKNVSVERVSIFQGVIRDVALQLWRISYHQIAFKALTQRSINDITIILEDYFQLKHNLVDLYKEWSIKDPNLAECCKHYEGFRILRQDPVENLFSFICATNNNIKRISQMIDSLCTRFGPILKPKGELQSDIYGTYRAFPSVERLADEDVFNCLRNELKFGYRAKYITQSAKQVMTISQEKGFEDPRVYLMSLRKLPYEETRKELMRLQGIGRKVADCICLMSMDHLDSVPVDCHIYEIVCRNYMPDLKSRHKTLTEKVHDMIRNYFKDLHGPLAGWSTSVLFIAELKHLKIENAKK